MQVPCYKARFSQNRWSILLRHWHDILCLFQHFFLRQKQHEFNSSLVLPQLSLSVPNCLSCPCLSLTASAQRKPIWNFSLLFYYLPILLHFFYFFFHSNFIFCLLFSLIPFLFSLLFYMFVFVTFFSQYFIYFFLIFFNFSHFSYLSLLPSCFNLCSTFIFILYVSFILWVIFNFYCTRRIIIIIIIIFVITLMHGIYNYIPETNRVAMLYSVAAVLYLQFVLHVMLFIILNMFCTFTSALPAVCVQCTVWLFFAVP